MVPALERGLSVSRSFNFRRIFDSPPSQHQSNHGLAMENGDADLGDSITPESQSQTPEAAGVSPAVDNSRPIPSALTRERVSGGGARTGSRPERQQSDMEMMKERFAKLLLGEDMSGGGKGVSSALALSNAITNLAAAVFGEQTKLQPMSPDRRARWKKEIDWLLSVTDHIVEFVPSQQMTKDGVLTEIMVTRQRGDLLMNIPALRKLDAMLIDTLENFRGDNEFYYVSRDSEEGKNARNARTNDKWWLPPVKVPPNGLSEPARRMLHFQKDSVTQVQKAAMAINAQVLSEMAIPESYIESLPKVASASLGDTIYKSITEEWFDPEQFLSAIDLSTEHKVLDLKNKIEASVVIWKRKLHLKDSKSPWGSAVSLEKRELFEERAETILVLLKQQFPGLPQSALDISKIQFNKDIGQAVLESYSRILESLAYTVMSRIEDVIYADSLAQKQSSAEETSEAGRTETDSESARSSNSGEESEKLETQYSKTLLDFMGWNIDNPKAATADSECQKSEKPPKSPNLTPKKFSYLEKLENLNGFRSPKERH
ncbi:PREDICTED: rho guanine nucleotide exchange factor 8-like [Tarenaya hassleriana]|uniref:rho guanine nucleotide exchange factor 8-like n=1 Tax=Tarenaya hassleriana TaxID=28532 RepID=UPI00053C661C|nr:PREDICTED: rho guanine nucleotide exchange factor 8-like [Tarenaya hassleriana]